jgi:hypothetical protein
VLYIKDKTKAKIKKSDENKKHVPCEAVCSGFSEA